MQSQHTGRGKGILGKCLGNFEIYKSPEEREQKHRLRFKKKEIMLLGFSKSPIYHQNVLE